MTSIECIMIMGAESRGGEGVLGAASFDNCADICVIALAFVFRGILDLYFSFEQIVSWLCLLSQV